MADGTAVTREIEVAENYFDPPATPEATAEEKQAEQIRAQNATITMLYSVLSDLQSDVEALQA